MRIPTPSNNWLSFTPHIPSNRLLNHLKPPPTLHHHRRSKSSKTTTTHRPSSPPPPPTVQQIPADPSTPHTSLPTFLTHAARTRLSPTSTVYVGTHYEYTCLSALRRFGLALQRTGGRLDKGIDLLGWWRLPSLFPTTSGSHGSGSHSSGSHSSSGSGGGEHRLVRALVQCKALRRKASPSVVRELEGAFNGLPALSASASASAVSSTTTTAAADDDYEQEHVVALLCAPHPATKGVRDALSRSRWPMGYVMVGLEGRVAQFLWNRAAAERGGVGGLSVGVRYLDRGVDGGKEDGEGVGEEEVGTANEKALQSEVVLSYGEGALWDFVEVGDGVQEEVDGAELGSRGESPDDATVTVVTGDDESSLHTVSSPKVSTRRKRRSEKAATAS